MKRFLQIFRRLTAIGLAVSILGACAVVPYGSPGYYGPPDRSYVPVPVPAPYFYYEHHRHHRHRGHR